MEQSFFLGLVQGFTEFLPISSSGHLLLVQSFLTGKDLGLAFDAFLHLGTLLAVLIYFRKDVVRLLNCFVNKADQEGRHLVELIIVGIIPAAIVGYWGRDLFADTLRLINLVIFNLIFWGLVMYLADRYIGKIREKVTDVTKLNFKQSIIIGFVQILAFLPGTSRSGITITAGLFQKIDRATSAKFSFLMSIPLIAAAGLASLLQIQSSGNLDWSIILVGLVSSFTFGLIAIYILMKILVKSNLKWFVFYRLLLGIFLILFLWLK